MRALPALLLLCGTWFGGQATLPARAQPVPDLALTPEQLGTLPQHQVTLSYGNPPVPHVLQGPLLWEVLTSSGTLDPARHAASVRQWLQVRAADGYTAVLALGELSPEFENKPALLAIRLDDMPLDRPRLAVPNERRAGRSVRDVVGLSIESLPEPRR